MRKQKGFTLIELLVVIAIIGILSSIAVVNLNSARNKAKTANVQGTLAGLIPAVVMCHDANKNLYQTGTTVCPETAVVGTNWTSGNTLCEGSTSVWPTFAAAAGTVSNGPCASKAADGTFSFSATVNTSNVITCTQSGCTAT